MNAIFKWLERLSLDAVTVAIVWGVALGNINWRSEALGSLFILAMATWLTYVADRLLEVQPGRTIPATDRHLYYKNNYMCFRIIWLAVFAGAVVSAAFLLPLWKLAGGWIMVGAIILYLWLIGRTKNVSKRILLKRTIVPVIFTSGVVWMIESWRSIDGITGSMVLLPAALANVLLISYGENTDKNRPAWLLPATIMSLASVSICALAALFIHLPTGLAGLVCSGGYFYQFIQIRAGKTACVRIWVDGVLAIAGLIQIISEF